MKKFPLFLLLAFTLLLTLAFPLGALAGAAETGTEVVETDAAALTEEPQPFTPFTWDYLASLAGATALTLIIVQFSKVPLDRVWRIPTRLFVYLIALVILIVATAFTTGLSMNSALMAFVNAFLVALTAYGSYEVTFARLDR